MNVIQLAELRAWLNRTRRQDWRIIPNRYPELKGDETYIIHSGNGAIRIHLTRHGTEWQANAVLNPNSVSGGTTLPRVHGKQPTEACQQAMNTAAASIAGPQQDRRTGTNPRMP